MHANACVQNNLAIGRRKKTFSFETLKYRMPASIK